ncbi:hypothetical protein AJ80_04685 [Polytolypa hystricis UAMH7299]|uniref:Uncharacterized protein n=1 Tax=Polytolypa hystricis (strain UAMH7299) TaxID=1447883 RepID=A0A2B7YAH0_POLH7|nr:hypothetical protein AJ80_04685 [Polytolypa hystricis UAMH7299]
MAANTNESLLSILCSGGWFWDSGRSNEIKFNEDGTGTLICRLELNVWIATEIDWKFKNPESLQQVVDLSGKPRKKHPQSLSKFDLEITLTKRRIPKLLQVDMYRVKLNEELLKDDAFVPKTYSIHLKKGDFLTDADARMDKQLPYTPHFWLRLVFDKSPYPPRKEWKEPSGAPDSCKFWEWKEFCGRQLPGKTESAWGNCVVC